MKIDIESLTYDELLELNHRIIERLKFLDSVNTHQKMMQFIPGDKVSFENPVQGTQIGTLVKFNKKTVTVVTDSGQKWNVSPHLLKKVILSEPNSRKSRKVIGIKDKN